MKKDKFKMENICCLECATVVEKEISRLNGVKDAIADYKKQNLLVEYNEKIIQKSSIEAKVKEVMKRFEI